MKLCLVFLIVSTSYSLAQAQHEIRCRLVDRFASSWNNTASNGSCSTSPQLWKRVVYQTSLDLGVHWYSLCDICPPEGTLYTITVPSVFSSGACYAPDGFVLEECWPIFFAPDWYTEPEYCGDVSFKPLKVRL